MRPHRPRKRTSGDRRVLVRVMLALCVVASVIASPLPRPSPAEAQSVLPPPCAQIVFDSGITCANPPLLSEDDVEVTTPFLNPKPIGLVAAPTSFLYLGAEAPLVNVPRTNPGCLWPGPPATVSPGPYNTFLCLISGGSVATYVRLRIPAGQELDFGSPDEAGETYQTVGWWPALIPHRYEQKGVTTIEYRVYWRELLIGCRLTFGPHPLTIFPFGWYCLNPFTDLFVESDGTDVAFITENTLDPYQVDESRGTLETW